MLLLYNGRLSPRTPVTVSRSLSLYRLRQAEMTIIGHLFSTLPIPRCACGHATANALAGPPTAADPAPRPCMRAEASATLTNAHLASFGKSGTTRAFCLYHPLQSPEVSCTPPAPATACLLDRRRAFSPRPLIDVPKRLVFLFFLFSVSNAGNVVHATPTMARPPNVSAPVHSVKTEEHPIVHEFHKCASGKVSIGYFTNWGIYVPNFSISLTDRNADTDKHFPTDSWSETGHNLYGCLQQLPRWIGPAGSLLIGMRNVATGTSAAQSLELPAKNADMLLRKNNKVTGDIDLEKALNRVRDPLVLFVYRERSEVEDRKHIDNPIVRFRLYMEACRWWSAEEEEVLRVLPQHELGKLFTDVYAGEGPWNIRDQKNELNEN
ncbi:hypothetical protein B0H14DRAFT_3469047 [Mycena olivaceomarginata]|nr:hypothetical protein B0H14DRAFT_3469047 [Mycena olivaceomarginata]